MLITGQPEIDENQDRHNDDDPTNNERPHNVEVRQHRGIGRGLADLLKHVPCLVKIGPVPSVKY